jgi:hypothetical protein
MSTMISPETGRLITIGGKTYQRLIKDPKYRDTMLNPSSHQPINQSSRQPSSKESSKRSKSRRSASPKAKGRVSDRMSDRVLDKENKISNLPDVGSKTSPPNMSLPKLHSPSNTSQLPPLPNSPSQYYPASPSSSLSKENTKRVSIIDQPLPIPTSKSSKKSKSRSSSRSSSKSSRNSKEEFYQIPTLEETLEHTNQPAKRAQLERMIETGNQTEGRGIKTRGWAARSPTRGTERHQLKEECGDKCFLLPEEEKFPVCPSPRTTGGTSVCKTDCGGAQAALVRARQYGYDEVAAKAEKLLEECNKEGLKNFTPQESRPSPPLSPAMTAAGRTTPENYGILRRNVRRTAIMSHYNHENQEQELKEHQQYMKQRYNWQDKDLSDYQEYINKNDFKNHHQYMKERYGWSDSDWRDYKQHMKNYIHVNEPRRGERERREDGHQDREDRRRNRVDRDRVQDRRDGVLFSDELETDLSPSMTRFGRNGHGNEDEEKKSSTEEGCGCGQ